MKGALRSDLPARMFQTLLPSIAYSGLCRTHPLLVRSAGSILTSSEPTARTRADVLTIDGGSAEIGGHVVGESARSRMRCLHEVKLTASHCLPRGAGLVPENLSILREAVQ